MTERTYEESAIQASKAAYPECTTFKVRAVLPEFYEGTLVIVAMWAGDDYVMQVNVYFDIDDVNPPTVFELTEDLVKALKLRKPRQKWEILLSKFLQRNFISAIVAILLTLTICILVIQKHSVPDILSNVLTIILGFYFGIQSKETT